MRRVITNFGKLSQELGQRDTQLAGFVAPRTTVLGAFANQQAAIRATLQELPGDAADDRSALCERRPLCAAARARRRAS